MTETYKITFRDGATQTVEADDTHDTNTWLTYYRKGNGGTRVVLRVAADAVLSVATDDVTDRTTPEKPKARALVG